MGYKMLHGYEPLKLENTAINTFKTFVVHGENTGHQAFAVKTQLLPS